MSQDPSCPSCWHRSLNSLRDHDAGEVRERSARREDALTVVVAHLASHVLAEFLLDQHVRASRLVGVHRGVEQHRDDLRGRRDVVPTGEELVEKSARSGSGRGQRDILEQVHHALGRTPLLGDRQLDRPAHLLRRPEPRNRCGLLGLEQRVGEFDQTRREGRLLPGPGRREGRHQLLRDSWTRPVRR
ncbi:MAG: hypothetical protein ACFHWZ_07605 [Phycisphaerales bacterium]